MWPPARCAPGTRPLNVQPLVSCVHYLCPWSDISLDFAGPARFSSEAWSSPRGLLTAGRSPPTPIGQGRNSDWDLLLQVESHKLAPWFVGPFPVSKVVNPVAVRLRLPRLLKVHPTFHVSRVKPSKESPSSPSRICLPFY